MTRISRRAMLAGLGVGLLGSVQMGAHAARRRPNIIFILADDLGYGDLGCYGQTRVQTPNIDQMAREGMRFTDAYAGSTVCAPSRCCLMTGQHTGHALVRGNALVPLRDGEVTVARVLKEAGYVTGLVGKWGLGEPGSTGLPRKQGFDSFFGYLNQRNAHSYYPPFLWRNEAREPLEGNVEVRYNVAEQRSQYSHDLFTKEALAFIERERAKPFFLYLAYTIPHANNERGGASGHGMEVPSRGRYEHEDWPDPQKCHAAMISRLDRDVGRLFEHLRRLGLDDDTIVFFSSDNGPHKEGGADPTFFESAGPLRGLKRDLYDGGIRAPFIVRWPGHVPAGEVTGHCCAFWDFLPTAADLAGAKIPEGLDGISILPTLRDRPRRQKQHEYLYWEFHEGAYKRAIRIGHHKAVLINEGPLEIYDLNTDLGERTDIAGQHPDLAAKYLAIIEGARTDSEHWPGKIPPPR